MTETELLQRVQQQLDTLGYAGSSPKLFVEHGIFDFLRETEPFWDWLNQAVLNPQGQHLLYWPPGAQEFRPILVARHPEAAEEVRGRLCDLLPIQDILLMPVGQRDPEETIDAWQGALECQLITLSDIPAAVRADSEFEDDP